MDNTPVLPRDVIGPGYFSGSSRYSGLKLQKPVVEQAPYQAAYPSDRVYLIFFIFINLTFSEGR